MFRGFGAANPMWKGGRQISSTGYVMILMRDYPRASTKGLVAEHILMAEQTLGKQLPKTADVHHVNENRADNSKGNLVICQSRKYHILLHMRMKSMKATGRPDMHCCSECKTWLSWDKFNLRKGNTPVNRCKECNKKPAFNWRNKDREAYNAAARERRMMQKLSRAEAEKEAMKEIEKRR